MPTWVTGSNRRVRSRREHRGFTLIELIVALSIAGLAIGALALSMNRIVEGAQYRATLRDLATEIRGARQTAMRSGEEAVFQFDPDARSFGREGALPHAVPTSLTVEFIGARSETTPDGKGQIRFYPDGSATGGSVIVLRPSGAGVQLRVGWLLGRLSWHPLS